MTTYDNETLITWHLQHYRDLAEGTRYNRRRALTRLAGMLPEGVGLIDATEDHLMAVRDSLQGGPDGRAQMISHQRMFYRWLKRYARARIDNPSEALDQFRRPRRKPRPPKEDQVATCLEAARHEHELYVWLRLMRFAGLRCCEVAWLRTDWMRQAADGRWWLDVLGKGRKVRSVPLDTTTAAELHRYRRGGGLMFTRPDGASWTREQVSQRVGRHQRRLGLTWGAHALRHGFGTHYHDEDPDVFRQADIMGHSSTDTTRLYTSVRPGPAADFVEAAARRHELRRQA